MVDIIKGAFKIIKSSRFAKLPTLGYFISFVFGILFGSFLLPADYAYDVMGPNYELVSHTHINEYNDTLAKQLFDKVRILCWVMTCPDNHESKARHVLRTWGKRCNRIIFMSTAEDKSLGAVALSVKEGRNRLWSKTKEAFKYVFQNHYNDADWFMKADDDSYVILENLRYMLYPYSANTPIYFGCKLKPFVKQGYMSGGAGYVLSKAALRELNQKALPNSTLCNAKTEGTEDLELGKCMENIGIIAGDSRDFKGRGRFFPFVPEQHLIPNINPNFWYWKYIYYDVKPGYDCCSDTAISFHYITPNQMYVMDYLIYYLHPFGIVQLQNNLPSKVADEDLNLKMQEDNINAAN